MVKVIILRAIPVLALSRRKEGESLSRCPQELLACEETVLEACVSDPLSKRTTVWGF